MQVYSLLKNNNRTNNFLMLFMLSTFKFRALVEYGWMFGALQALNAQTSYCSIIFICHDFP